RIGSMGRCCKWLTFWLSLALCLPAYSAAESFYVSPGGVDSRPCDLAGAPCRTITRALERARAQAGDHTVHVAARDGGSRAVYREAVQIRRGALHRPQITLDGSWRATGDQRALIAPPASSGASQAVLLELN